MYHLDASDAILLYYLFIAKILPALVTYFADKYFNINIKFKSLSVLNASVQNVSIKWKGYEISIGEVCLKSKFLNKDYKKPLCVDFDDVKICQTFDNDLQNGQQQQQQQEEHLKVKDYETFHEHRESNVKSNNLNVEKNVRWGKKYIDNLICHIKRFLPPTIMMTLKFLQIRMKNLSTTLLNKDRGPMATFSIPEIEFLFEGCIVRDERTLFIALALQHIKSKFIAYNKQNPSRKPPQACLAEIIFDITFEVEILWQNGRLAFEKQHVSVSNAQVTFYGGLFDMIEHTMLHRKGTMSSTANSNLLTTSISTSSHQMLEQQQHQPSRIKKLIARLTPHAAASIRIEQIEVKSLNKQSSYHYHLLLYSVDAKLKFKDEDGNFIAKAKVSNLRIYTPAHEVLYLKELTADMRSNGNVIRGVITLDTVDAVYNHEDIFGWVLKIITAGMKSNRRELILEAIEIGNKKMMEFYHSDFVRNIFNHIVFNGSIELRQVELTLELDDQISSFNAMKIKFLLNQAEKMREISYADYTLDLLFKNRHWNMDAISDGSMRFYMGSKYPTVRGDFKNTYVRGSAFFIDSLFARICSHKDDFKINLRVNTFRMEYSNKLTQFTVQSAKSYKAFVNLFTQMKRKKIESDSCEKSVSNINFEDILKKFSINLKIYDISCYFINRHDVCTFVNLSNISSTDNFNYTLEALRVSTIDFRKYDGMCDLSEFCTTFISTSLLKFNLEWGEQMQLCVDFAEKLECSWNAHFLRHTLSLIRDFRKFKKNIEEALEIEIENKPLLPRSLPLGLDIKKLRNIRVKHADVNIDKLFLLINELSGENLFFYNYFH